MSSIVCKYYSSKPLECSRTDCDVRIKISVTTQYCPIYFCRLTGASADSKPTNKSLGKDSISPSKPRPQPSLSTIAKSKKFLSPSSRLVYENKRKAALIGVLTLGLAGLSVLGVGNTWRMNIFAGTSFDKGGVGFVMKCLSFCLLSVIVAIPCFIISFFRLIYYSIKLSQ